MNVKNPNIKDREKLSQIKRYLRRGDLRIIAKELDFTPEYVGKVLSPKNDFYQFDIIRVAMELALKRKQESEELNSRMQNEFA